MMTRRAIWATSGVAGAILLAAGLWAGKSLPTSTATPEVLTGTVSQVGGNGEEFAVRLGGSAAATGYGLGSTSTPWRDEYGNWQEGTAPACMKPLSRGQHITFGVVHTQPTGEAPGVQLVVWLECARVPVPHFPVVTPRSSGPA